MEEKEEEKRGKMCPIGERDRETSSVLETQKEGVRRVAHLVKRKIFLKTPLRSASGKS